jgi:hypothetical protein
VQSKRTALRGVKEILSYQYSLVEKQTHEECPHTQHSDWRGQRGSVSSHLVATVNSVDPLDGHGNFGPGRSIQVHLASDRTGVPGSCQTRV